MNTAEVLTLIDLIIWPIIALTAMLLVRPHISRLLSGAKVTFSVAGQSIETTIPELKRIFEEQSGIILSKEHIEYLQSLRTHGPREYKNGVSDESGRMFLRPMRNAGLILVVPRNAFLQQANSVELSALGRLYLEAKV